MFSTESSQNGGVYLFSHSSDCFGSCWPGCSAADRAGSSQPAASRLASVQEQLVESKRAVSTTLISLCKMLGGGWETKSTWVGGACRLTAEKGQRKLYFAPSPASLRQTTQSEKRDRMEKTSSYVKPSYICIDLLK
jgi:hypothetical protein